MDHRLRDQQRDLLAGDRLVRRGVRLRPLRQPRRGPLPRALAHHVDPRARRRRRPADGRPRHRQRPRLRPVDGRHGRAGGGDPVPRPGARAGPRLHDPRRTAGGPAVAAGRSRAHGPRRAGRAARAARRPGAVQRGVPPPRARARAPLPRPAQRPPDVRPRSGEPPGGVDLPRHPRPAGPHQRADARAARRPRRPHTPGQRPAARRAHPRRDPRDGARRRPRLPARAAARSRTGCSSTGCGRARRCLPAGR